MQFSAAGDRKERLKDGIFLRLWLVKEFNNSDVDYLLGEDKSRWSTVQPYKQDSPAVSMGSLKETPNGLKP